MGRRRPSDRNRDCESDSGETVDPGSVSSASVSTDTRFEGLAEPNRDDSNYDEPSCDGPNRVEPNCDKPNRVELNHDDRALLGSLVRGLLNLVVVLLLLAGLVLGVLVLSPIGVEDLENLDGFDEVEIEGGAEPSSEPPPAGERNPNVTDPDDPGESTYETDVETVSSQAVEDFVHAEVNERRADHDLDPLEWDGTVASVSRAHSDDMAQRDYFAHTNPEGDGPYDRFTDVDDYCQAYGENIAMTWVDRPVDRPGDGDDAVEYQTAEGLATGLVDQWMNSTEHREAILEEHASHGWERGGVGVYIDDDGAVYAAHNFCLTW